MVRKLAKLGSHYHTAGGQATPVVQSEEIPSMDSVYFHRIERTDAHKS